MRGADSVVVCVQKKVPVIYYIKLQFIKDKLIREDSVSAIYRITDRVGCICTGNMSKL